jgi:hypothetical protein
MSLNKGRRSGGHHCGTVAAETTSPKGQFQMAAKNIPPFILTYN